jgi:hypothetical protein
MSDESKAEKILKNIKMISIDYKDSNIGPEILRPNLLKRTFKVTPNTIKPKQDIQIFKPIKLDGTSPVNKTEADFMTYRTNYMLKFSRNFEAYDRIFRYFEHFNEGAKRHIIDLFNKMKSVNDSRDKIIFDQAKAECNIEFYKNVVNLQYEQEVAFLRLLENSVKEVRKYKENNNELFRRENEALGSKEEYGKELSKLKKLVDDNDINYKDMVRKKKLNETHKVKEEFERRERVNMIQNFRLEEE